MPDSTLDLEALRRLAIIVMAGGRMDSRDLVAVGRSAPTILAALERIPELERENARLQETLALHENPGKIVVHPEAWKRAEQLETLARKLVQRGPQSAVWPEFFDLVMEQSGAWKRAAGRAAAQAEECPICGTTDLRHGHADDCDNGPAAAEEGTAYERGEGLDDRPRWEYGPAEEGEG